jgi:hypothetical protein
MEWDGEKVVANWDKVVGTELYDHTQNNQFDNSCVTLFCCSNRAFVEPLGSFQW